MIARYTRPELAEVWSDHAHFEAMRRVEVAACEELDGPTSGELDAIRAATFTLEAIAERERVTDHDTAAFVDVLAESAGPAGRWIHHGLTSSDVLDTGLALQLRRVGEIVLPDARRLVESFAAAAREHVDTVCAGRTHGIHAEPTTFGIKLAGFAFEAARNAERLARAFDQVAIGALSGAVGTYSATSPGFEERVLARLGLAREPVSTQVVPRDRHAELLQAIALAGAGMERFATEVRNLARTEVGEVREPFGRGQKGSSAMPHKRNPIKSEQVVGLARVLRGNAVAALEDVALWHERDISHSSVERVILPDSTILLDHLQRRVLALIDGMVVDVDRMRENLELTHGALFSQRVLLALVASGLSRDDAYRVVQRVAQQAIDSRVHMRDLLATDPAMAGLDLDAIFDYGPFVRFSDEIVGRLDAISAASPRVAQRVGDERRRDRVTVAPSPQSSRGDKDVDRAKRTPSPITICAAVPPRKHQELMTAAVARDGEGQRALQAGDREGARSAFATAADLYRQSWEQAPSTAYGRLVGMLKSAVLAGAGEAEAGYVRSALGDRDPTSSTASYAQALAALILSEDADAGAWAGRMGGEAGPFARTAEAIAALAAHDAGRYAAALAEIVRDFEQRTEHLTGVAIADTALVLSELGARRGMAVAIESPVLPLS